MCTARRTVLDKSSASDQGASLYSAVEDSVQDQEDKVKDQEDSVQDQEDRVKDQEDSAQDQEDKVKDQEDSAQDREDKVKDQEDKSQDRIIQIMIMKITSHKTHQVQILSIYMKVRKN